MKNKYCKNIRLCCVVCGSDSDFEFNEDKSYIKCKKCNREYKGGYDELVELNRDYINEEVERTKMEVAAEMRGELTSMLKEAFKGNKHFKIK